MKTFLFALRFGTPFLKPYWWRLALGVGFGILFGLFGSLSVLSTKVLFDRLVPQAPAPSATVTTPALSLPPTPSEKPSELTSLKDRWTPRLKSAEASANAWLDRWLPRVGYPLDWRQFVGCLLFLPALVTLRSTLNYLSGYYMAWVSERMMADMQQAMLAKAHQLSVEYFVRKRGIDINARIMTDTNAVYQMVRVGFSDLVKQPITIVGVFVTMLALDWQLTFVTLLLVPGTLIPAKILGKKVRDVARRRVELEVTQSHKMLQGIGNMTVVKAFRLEAFMEKQFARYRQTMVSINMRSNRAETLLNPVVEVITMFGLSGIFLFLFSTDRPASTLVAFMTAVALFARPFKELARINVTIEKARASIERLQDTLQEEPRVIEPSHPQPKKSFENALTVDHLRFDYGGDPVLHDLSFTLPKGQKLGIAGESGCGKSTLINLVMRFYDPVAGHVLIDGVDVREIGSDDLRNLLSIVVQGGGIFTNITVAENIEMGRLGASREAIIQAARDAQAHDFIMTLDDGYDTMVGPGGAILSGGMAQRLAIARAFVRDAPILVLDEATAALDADAESEVQAALDNLAQSRTVIMIAHRLSTLRSCEQILVMEQGRIAEQGTFDQLLAAGGIFTRMCHKQSITA